jgi:NADPH:quinone reductase-like Zn-dependent oxidoreductase
LAVQIAKSLGAYVIGTASAAKHDFVRGLGADEVIDYRTTDFAEELTNLDVVLDSIGGDYGVRSLRTLRRGGHLIALTQPAEATLTAAVPLGIHAGFTLYEPDNAGLLAVKRLVETGQLKVTIDTVFPLEEAAKAHELGEAGRTTGKIVLSVVA